MYVLIAYDVVGGRTETFRKLLSKYLLHEQQSVFAGNLKESQLLKLRKELSAAAVSEDSFIEIVAENRYNVSVSVLAKNEGNGILEKRQHDHHAKDSIIL